MRLDWVLGLLALGMISMSSISCGDDTPDKGFELISYLDGNYTPTDDACHLSATINGKEVSEKASVTFHTKDLQTGNMFLKNFFEGYASLEIEEFTLIQETEGESVRFTFTGTQRVDETLQFSYSGYVVYGKLYIEFNIQ